MGTIFKLIIEDDEGKTTVYPLSYGEISIGRKEGNTIRLMERNVSRRHARLLRNNGTVFIEDLDSYNGIRINGERINGRYEVKEGDLVEIGDYHLALQAAEIEDDISSKSTRPDTEVHGNEDWRSAGTVPEYKLPAELSENRPREVSKGGTRDTLVDAQLSANSPPPIPKTSGPNAAAGMQSRLHDPPSLPPFPPPSNPVRPAGAPNPAASTEHDRPKPPALKGRDTELIATTPIQVGPARVAQVPRLICVSTNYAGREYPLTRPEVIIGRVEDNDIVIEHRSVSRNHAKIVFDGRAHKIIDLQSANGILVNGEEYAMTDLRKGDLIELGHVRFRFIPSNETFAPSEDELREMRDAGLTPPSSEATTQAVSLDVVGSGSATLRDSAQQAGPKTNPNPKMADSGESTARNFDLSTAATVADTPISSISPAPQSAPLPSQPEKKASDPVRRMEAAQERPRAEAKAPEAPAPRANGAPSHATAQSAKSEEKASSRASTVLNDAEGTKPRDRSNSMMKVMLGVGIAVIGVLIYLVVGMLGAAGDRIDEKPIDPQLQALYTKGDWKAVVQRCDDNLEVYQSNMRAAQLCVAAKAQLKKMKPPPEPETVNEEPGQNPPADVEEEETEEVAADTRKDSHSPALRTKKTPVVVGTKENRLRAKKEFERGQHLLLTGDNAGAISSFKACLDLFELAECYRSLGVAYASEKDTDESLRNYRAYLRLKPNDQIVRGIVDKNAP